MSKLSQIILEKIQKEHTKPVPKLVFQMKYFLIWMLVIVSILITALFVSSLLTDFLKAEWSLASRWPGHSFGFMRDFVAWVWVVGIFIAGLGGFLFIRMTRRGYRYGAALITSFLVITIILTGVSLLPTPFPEQMRTWHTQNMPTSLDLNIFHNADEGRLVGKITEKNGDTAYLAAVDGEEWELWLFDDLFLPLNESVVVFGEKMDEKTFAVLSIRPIPEENFVQENTKGFRIPQ